MRRIILTSLVLFPVLAHAQASTSTELQPSPASAVLKAELSTPSGLSETALAAAKTPATIPSIRATGHAAVRESIHTQFTGDFLEASLRMGGALEYSMKGSAPLESSAPKVTKAVAVDLSADELAAQPAVSSVVVHAVVDEQGIPRNVGVTHSAGKVLDAKAIAAVSQYRFKPATMDNQATWAEVSIAIQIKKQ